MKKIAMMLLLAAPIMACGPDPSNPDVDGGNNNTFEATLSMSLPSGSPAADFLVDGETVCTSVTSCDHKVHVAGVYEIESQGSSLLGIPTTAEVDANGDLVLLDIIAGIPLNGHYATQDTNCASVDLTTSVVDGKIVAEGFAFGTIPVEITGNNFFGENDAGTSISGTILSNGDALQVLYAISGGDENDCNYSRL